ncbi:MAG: AMP-binding protein [Nocardioidaceae bacterium]
MLSVIDDLVRGGDAKELSPPSREGRSVILTSGTTGTPKGANRPSGTLTAAAALVSRIPLRFGRSTHIAAPMFHTWGWAHLNLAMLLGSTLVLRTRFDPEGFLAAVSENRCDAAVVIPVMLRRVLELAGADTQQVRHERACGWSQHLGRRCPATWRPSGWMHSATTSTTRTARPSAPG